MKAARMYGINDIRLEEVATPKAGKGEVVIQIKSAAVCGTDVRMITSGAKGIDENHPKILGHEFAGVISEVGEDVETYKVGQRVAFAPNFGCGCCKQCISGNSHLCKDYQATGINIDGGFAEYVLIPEIAVRSGNIIILNDNVSFDEGAINEPLSCVYNGFEHANIHPGDVVLVVGGGPIGLMHCALALMAGGVVYLNDLSIDRLKSAQELYPNIHIIEGNPENEIMKASSGLGADVVICACPVPSVQAQAIEIASIGARVVFFGGIPANKEPVCLNTNLIHYKQLIVTGTTRASLSQYSKTLDFISKGVLNVKPILSNYYSIEQINEAIENTKRGIGYKNIIRF
mgnify:CR=1 FL=1